MPNFELTETSMDTIFLRWTIQLFNFGKYSLQKYIFNRLDF